jgi:two-component system CheB/CheR fusion protein
MTEPRRSLVVVGCSAGGVEALSKLLRGVPTGFLAPIVVAQHLAPTRPSHLAEILARHCALRVCSVSERERLEPGTVYVVPPDRNVEVVDGELSLHATDDRPMPSVDLLFSSAANAYGENVIAVILTGMGSDGAAGARDVKRAGGTIIVENPETASFPSMPESLAKSTVDVAASLERIGPLLHELLTKEQQPVEPDDEALLARLLEQVRGQSGIDFASYKPATIRRRLQRRVVATDSGNLAGYLRHLEGNPDEVRRLTSSFLIKVTEFLRDREFFESLRLQLLPDIIATARTRGRELRIWSAGCATGEEAYSIAILVSELLGDEVDSFTVRIFATDVDADAVAFARRARYPASALTELDPVLVERYFSYDHGAYVVRKRLRSLTVFGEHDLGQRAPFPHIDLVLCRNVLIYFTAELQRRTLQLFAYSLRDGGYLALGRAETTTPAAEYFTAHNALLRIYCRRGDRVLLPPARLHATSAIGRSSLTPRSSTPAGTRAQSDASVRGADRESLLAVLPIGVVVVDRRYDVMEINSAARQLLGIYRPALGEDLVHLSPPSLSVTLRSAIDGVFGGEPRVAIDAVEVAAKAEGQPVVLRVSVVPHAVASGEELVHAVVLLEDVTAEAASRRALQALSDHTAREARAFEEKLGELSPRIGALEAQNRGLEEGTRTLKDALAAVEVQLHQAEALRASLGEVNRELLAANAELSKSTERLRATNDRLQSESEENQAATEEVETLNEEFQATNEELETLNEELQATVEELNTTNNDLEARGVELRELALVADAERARLAAVLASIADARLQQVIVNLLSNAARYAPGSDHVDVRLLREPGQRVKLEVQDYGPGIAAAELANLFTPFFQGAHEDRGARGGLGLGLFICKEIVEAHGGTIEVSSSGGTTFAVHLPLASE